jgi:hypothetical protein
MPKGKPLWVVEMLMPHNGRWEPTVGAGITRDDARRELRVWRERNQPDRFRIVPYMRRAKGREKP